MESCRKIDRESADDLLSEVDTFLLDCDGVLWRGSDAIPGSVETVQRLTQLGKQVFYVTNNSSKTRHEYVRKFHSLGFLAELDQIISTPYVAATYLKNMDFQGKVYLIGGSGSAKELDDYGIKHTEIGPDLVQGTLEDWTKTELDPEVNCVLIAFDPHLSYPKVLKAASYLQKKNCLFLATNEDASLPVNGDILMPGTGVMIEAVKLASQREPIVMGKPHSPIFNLLMKMHSLEPSRTIMIGDRLNTDMGLAVNCHLKSMLVLSGISTEQDLRQSCATKQIVPNYFAPRLGALGEFLPK